MQSEVDDESGNRIKIKFGPFAVFVGIQVFACGALFSDRLFANGFNGGLLGVHVFAVADVLSKIDVHQ